jgi:hypothetical protein
MFDYANPLPQTHTRIMLQNFVITNEAIIRGE